MMEDFICGSVIDARSFDFSKRRQSASMIYRTGSMSNPYLAYDDGFAWPDLFTECDEMIESCVLVSLLAEIRLLVRKGEATTKMEAVMKMPLPALDLMRVIDSSRLLLTMDEVDTEATGCTAVVTNNKAIKYRHHLLRTADEREMRTNRKKRRQRRRRSKQPQDSPTSTTSSDEDQQPKKKNPISPTFFVGFHDNLQSSDELTYAISVNHLRQRITLSFRGSVVSNLEWATDFDAYMKQVENPMKMHSSQQPTMKIHSKLYDLLYAKASRPGDDNTSENNHGSNGEVYTEFMDILQNKIRPTTLTYPGYKLYITGYSQGGALATLFSFLAAAEPDAIIPKPVTCVSIASPYVGDESFRLAHQMLEGLGKLRHVRITNHKDVVTTWPKMSFRWRFHRSRDTDDGAGHVGSLFKHVGMNLNFYEKDKTAAPKGTNQTSSSLFEVFYPKVRSGFFLAHYWDELTRGWYQSPFKNFSCNPSDYWTWPWHNIREYNKRLQRNKSALQSMSLNELYLEKDIVGDLRSQF